MTASIYIIGGGPAGCLLASKLASNNVNVTVFEEHPEIGLPDHCAGLVNCKNLQKFFNPPKKIIKNIVKGAVIRYNHGVIYLSRNIDEAYVIDRPGLDQYLALKAQEKGAAIRVNQKIVGLKRVNGMFKLISATGEAFNEASVIVNAAGVKGLFSKTINPIASKYLNATPAIQYEMYNVKDISKDHVELYFNNDLTPGFFSWIIPLNEETVRVGVGARASSLQDRIQYFIRKIDFNAYRFRNSKLQAVKKGLILTGGPVNKTYWDGGILLGDAAAQVKPTTGGGLILAGLCANIAARILIKAAETRNFSSSFLSKYQASWRSILSAELTYMKYVRYLLDGLDNTHLTMFFEKIKDSNIVEAIISEGDMDFQAKTVKSVMKKPMFIRLIPLTLLGLTKHALK